MVDAVLDPAFGLFERVANDTGDVFFNPLPWPAEAAAATADEAATAEEGATAEPAAGSGADDADAAATVRLAVPRMAQEKLHPC